MPICNSCGSQISANQNVYRREIYSGQTKRVNYGKRITFGNSTHYSVKNVCADCANAIDAARARSSRNTMIVLLSILIIGIVYYISKQK